MRFPDPRELSSVQSLAATIGVAAAMIAVGTYMESGFSKPMTSVAAGLTAVCVLFFLWSVWKQQEPEPTEDVHPTHPVIVAPPARVNESADSAAPRSAIEQVRDLLGEPPRHFDPSLEAYLNIRAPFWLRPPAKDELAPSLEAQETVRRTAPVVWAAIVQANKALFGFGPSDSPASILWSLDPTFDRAPDELAEIARSLFELKGTDQADPESAAFARVLTNELTRAMRLRVPKRFAGERDVYHSGILISRKHLPKGYLAGDIFPIWVDPDTGDAMIVPAAYWPPSLTLLWHPDRD